MIPRYLESVTLWTGWSCAEKTQKRGNITWLEYWAAFQVGIMDMIKRFTLSTGTSFDRPKPRHNKQARSKTAIWVFHGGSEPTVPVAGSRRKVEALRAAKGQPKYTEYSGVKHDSWLDAYPGSALHKWMFEQKRQR